MTEQKKQKTLIKKCTAAAICILILLQLLIPCVMTTHAAAQQVIVITGSTVNIRSGAGTNNSKIGSAKEGTVYTYLGDGKDSSGTTWYKIQFSSSTVGWVTSQYSIKTAYSSDYTQSFINSIAAYYGAAGVQVAVIENGIVTSTYNYGWATKDSTKMSSDSKIRVASISKVAVAINAMKMQEQGIVDISKNIGAYWGTNPYKAITLKALLTHTSTLRALSYNSTRAGTLSQLTNSASYNSGTVGSSSVWAYNNYAVGVAGSTLEVAANKTLSSYAVSNIFNPLGMDASFSSGLLKDTSKLATLYYSNGDVSRSVATSKSLVGSTTPGNNTSIFAGGLTCSAKDLAKMIAMLANDGKYNGVQVLTASSVSAIESQQFTASEYGASFSQSMPLRYKANLYGESGIYYHTGNAYGVLALASYNPSNKNGVVVITTGMSDSSTTPACGRDTQGIYVICSKISEQIYRSLAVKGTTPTTTTTTIPTTAPTAPSGPTSPITLPDKDITMHIGEAVQFILTRDPLYPENSFNWSSSSQCVSVNSTGNITALSYGKATITIEGYDKRSKFTVNVVPDVNMSMLGASIRVSDPYGIRFGVQINKNDTYRELREDLLICEYGILTIGAGTLGSNELTLTTEGAQRIKAENLLSEDDSQLTYTGVITNIPQSFYDTNITARGYFIYLDSEGKKRVIYTDTITKNYTEVAEAALNTYNAIDSPSTEEQAIISKLETIISEQTGGADNEL